jgi:hypothetical protein
MLETDDMNALKGLTERVTDEGLDEPYSSSIEKTLYTALTRRIKRGTRENEAAGIILDNLWRSYIEARNLSIILHGDNIERDAVRDELIIA